jgi:tetratricopeptide (TPR) repeat protein
LKTGAPRAELARYSAYELGEAYMLAGDKDNAIKNYEKSVQINPANWRGVDALRKLKGQGR